LLKHQNRPKSLFPEIAQAIDMELPLSSYPLGIKEAFRFESFLDFQELLPILELAPENGAQPYAETAFWQIEKCLG
jgi:hypothetical protein